MNVHTLEVRFDARKARRDAAQFDDSMARLDKRAGGLGRTMVRLSALVGGLSFAVMARDMGGTIIETEKMMASLEVLTGGIDNARDAWGALNEFARTTPFTMDQSVQAFSKMKALGLEPTAEAMTSFGNTASAMGKDLNQMIEAVADASTMEFERLKEFGIKARQTQDEVSFTFQGITTTVGKSADEIVGYLETIGQAQFAGAMEKQMERLPGKISNLRDTVQNLWRAIGDQGATAMFGRVVDAIASGVNRMLELVSSGFAVARLGILLTPWVQTFKEAFGIISEAWIDATKNMEDTTTTLVEDQLTWFENLQAAFATLPKTFQVGWSIIVITFSAALEQLWQQFQSFVKLMGVGVLQVQRGFEVMWEQVKLLFLQSLSWLTEKLEGSLRAMAEGLPDFKLFDDLRNSLNGAADALGQVEASEKNLRAEMEASKLAHADRIDLVFEEIAAHQDNARAIDQAAIDTVNALLEEDRALKESTGQRILATRALLDAVDSGETWQEILERLAKSQEDLGEVTGLTTDEIEAQQKAYSTLSQKLQPYTDKLRGISEEERRHFDNLMLAEEAIRLNIIAADEYTRFLELLDEGLEEVTTGTEAMSEAMKAGIQRMDGVWGNFWQNFVKEGTSSFDQLADGFESMLGEMIHAATTRPIMVQLNNAANGEAVDFKALGEGILNGVAVAGGAALGGGGENASLGSSIGYVAGSFLPIPGGQYIGAAVGGLIGGMFDRDTQITLGGEMARGAQDPRHDRGSTAFGTVVGIHGSGGVGNFGGSPDIADDMLDAIRGFDRDVADLLSDEDIEKVTERMKTWRDTFKEGALTVENIIESRFEHMLGSFSADIQAFAKMGDTFEERFNRFTLAIQASSMIDMNPELFGERGLAQFLVLAEEAQERGEDMATTFNRLVSSMIAAQLATEMVVEFTEKNLVDAYAEMVRTANMTVREQLLKSAENVRMILGEYDDTATSMETLANGVRAHFALQIEMMKQLDAVAAAASDRFTSLANSINEFINPMTIDDYTNKLDDLFLELSTAVDPAEVDRISAEIERTARLAWNALPDDMKQAMGQQFVEMLAEADRLTQERLELIRAQVVTESEILRSEVEVLMQGISDPMGLVANDLGIAASLLIEAGEAWNPGPAGPPGAGPGYGGRDPFGDDGGAATPPGGVYTPSNLAIESAAVTLQTEGEAYRTAQATMTRQLAEAIASIPNRIVVQVNQPEAGEYT